MKKSLNFPRLDIRLKDWEFEFQQRNEHPILMADFWCRSLYFQFRKEINLPVNKLDYLFTATSKGYVKRKQKKNVIAVLKKAVQKEKYLRYVFRTTQKRIYEFERLARIIINKIYKKKTTKEGIAALWREFDEKFLTLIPWFFIPWYITEKNILSDRVKSRLMEHKEIVESITDFNNALMVLIFPTKRVLFQKEQDEFFGLVKFAQRRKDFEKDKNFLKKAQNYLHQYAWTKTFLLLPIKPLTLKELLGRVKDAVKKQSINEYCSQKAQLTKNKKLARKLIKKLNFDKDLLSDINWACEYGWLLTWSVERALIATAKLQPFFKLIAENLNFPYARWVLLTSEEIINGLRGKFYVTKNELEKRKVGYVFLMENGRKELIVGSKAKRLSQWIDTNIGTFDAKTDVITGQPVSPGIIRGRVRISILAKEAHRVKEGEILVCSMTSPDYVPAMKRVRAVVTDEGGLLSHAAIVSRELGKPCIVGTKIATEVLKDGDLVEVDANKGVVKILEKK